jgi:pimeloyl-ACP methyl ester carboxylesterase
MGAEASATGRWIEVNGARLYCEDHGAGPPIVLIHAGLISGAVWEPLLPALIDDFRVIMPDSRGHGRSTNPSGEMSYAQIADDVAALITALELDGAVVGGYSDGGQVALEIGARHPAAAGGLIIGAAYPDFVTTGLREFLRAYLGADDAGTPDVAAVEARLGELADPVKSLHPGGTEQWHALVHQSARMWLDYEGLTPDDLDRINAPALVFVGDRDEAFTLDLTVSLYRALPNAELGVCPHADHRAPITRQRIAVFAGMIRDFASRHGQAP